MGGPYNLQTFFGLYNFVVNTSMRVLFLPPSDAYVRSFLYLLYTLIKLYNTKALSDQASSLAPDWILLLQRPRIPVYSRDSTTTFHQHQSLFPCVNSLHEVASVIKFFPLYNSENSCKIIYEQFSYQYLLIKVLCV